MVVVGQPEVFMRDSGALALGATLAVVALMLGQVLLPMIGFVWLISMVTGLLGVALALV
jgi:UDP-N-acetylmuramyl pentapeptide phosphotransferase/UDP-N-acetylglucosamine-1-phosphate transferase